MRKPTVGRKGMIIYNERYPWKIWWLMGTCFKELLGWQFWGHELLCTAPLKSSSAQDGERLPRKRHRLIQTDMYFVGIVKGFPTAKQKHFRTSPRIKQGCLRTSKWFQENALCFKWLSTCKWCIDNGKPPSWNVVLDSGNHQWNHGLSHKMFVPQSLNHWFQTPLYPPALQVVGQNSSLHSS